MSSVSAAQAVGDGERNALDDGVSGHPVALGVISPESKARAWQTAPVTNRRRVLLHVERGGRTLASRPLGATPFVVGGGDGVSLRVKGAGLRERHLVLELDERRRLRARPEGDAVLRVDGASVASCTPKDGDVLDLGPVQIRIEHVAAPPPAPRTVSAPSLPRVMVPAPRAFLVLSAPGCKAQRFELPSGRFAVGSGPCAIHLKDATLPVLIGEWFRAPTGSVFYTRHPGEPKLVMGGQSVRAGKLSMSLEVSGGPPPGPVAAAPSRALAEVVALDFALPPPELLSSPGMPAVGAPAAPSAPASPTVAPEPEAAPAPSSPPSRGISPWAVAPLLIALALFVGGRLRGAGSTEAVLAPPEPVAAQTATLAEPVWDPARLLVLEDGAPDPAFHQQVQESIWRHRRAHATCFDPLLAADPTLNGVLWLEVSVAQDGRLLEIAPKPGSSISDPAVEECLMAYFAELQYPVPPEPPFAFAWPLRVGNGEVQVPTP